MKDKILDKRIWSYIFGIAILVVLIINLSSVTSFIGKIWTSCSILVFGAMLAFVINLIMRQIEKWVGNVKILKKKKRPISLLLSLIVIVFIFYFIVTLVVPTLIEAAQVIVGVLPEMYASIQKFLLSLFENNPQIARMIMNLEINWKELINQAWNFLSSGIGSLLGTTFNVVTTVVNSVFNVFLMIIVAIYLLLEKERFFRLYHRLTGLYLNKKHKAILDDALKTINQSFSAFITGQCIEATILGSLCALGMTIFRMPYALMIGMLVGVINMIPMIGAYIGGAIGMFLVFTVNPITSFWFLIYLCILQQIESNVFYPRVVGSSVGLPGVYVMMTVIIFGSLAGIPGMLLGIPIVASIYKLAKKYVSYKEQQVALPKIEVED